MIPACVGEVDLHGLTTHEEVFDAVAALAEEVLDAPLSEAAVVLCVDAANREMPLSSTHGMAEVRHARELRVTLPGKSGGAGKWPPA